MAEMNTKEETRRIILAFLKKEKEQNKTDLRQRFFASLRRKKEPNEPNETNLRKLTPDERTQMMNEGRCFRCRKLGHLSKNCLGQGKKPEPRETPVPRKRTGEETTAYIRKMVANMDNKEKKKLQEEADKDKSLDF